MKMESLLPQSIKIMTRNEAVVYVNEAHPGTASAILVISPEELPFPFIQTEWNGVRETLNIRIPKKDVDSRGHPISMERSIIKNDTTDNVIDFILDIAGDRSMNPLNELVIVAYARHPITSVSPGYQFDLDASAETVAYTIAAAVADWATGSDARSYYEAKGVNRISQTLYCILSEKLADHEPSLIDMPII